MTITKEKVEKSLQPYYELKHGKNVIMYMQKCVDSCLFVAPGYPYLTKPVHEGVLIAAGAKKKKHQVLKRYAVPVDKDNIPGYAVR